VLRSSSIYFRGDNNEVIGALCVNLDITQSLQCEEFLRQFNQFSPERKTTGDDREPVKEIFANSVQELLEYLIGEALVQVGKAASQMNRADKLMFIRFLDQKGAFLITRSGDMVCDFLKISKYTLYRYLDITREGQEVAENTEE
jgi:predicted transcriptional regulator YheO